MPKEVKQDSRQFEDSMKRLETIVDLLEGEEVSLDEALKRYEEGIKLVRFCSKKLKEAQKKIEILSRDEEGEVVKKVFEIKKSNGQPESDGGQEEDLLF